MAHDSDSDEVFTSAKAVRPEEHLTMTVSRMMKRLELAEKILTTLLDNAFASDGTTDEDALLDAIYEWEELRCMRFIYTDDCEYVIATGRGGLSRYFDEYGYDVNQSNWRALDPTETITINCDEEGDIAPLEDGGTPVTKTAEEWLAKVKANGLLCVTED